MVDKELSKEMKEELILYRRMQKDPFLFIKLMWNIIPQPLKPNPENVEDWGSKQEHYEKYVKWQHISWQQCIMLQALKDAYNWVKSRKISIRSWRWVGKTAYLSWATLWFLYCNAESIVTCTGPSSKQLQDWVRKEISVWLDKMPPTIASKFDKTSEYLRVIDCPAKWYARVVTGTKENPANVSWVHSDNVMVLVDEAPWVEDIVMDAVKGMMTSANAILIMIGNPIRLSWYFYDTHNKLKDNYQTFAFSGQESPNVDRQYVEEQAQEYWIDSDEYRFNVLWEFPKAEWTDDWGRIPLLQPNDLHLTFDSDIKPFRMGIDPSGQWRDDSKFVWRDTFKAKVIWSEKVSDPKSVAGIALTLWTQYDIKWEQFYIDNFGVGANVAQELALAGVRANALNVWNPARDSKRFKNIRAEAYRAIRERCKKWWELVNNKAREDELLKIKYRRDLDGRIQIMPKAEMKKRMWKSPDTADALALTFIDWEDIYDSDDFIEVDYWAML